MLKYDPAKFKSIFEKNFTKNFKKKQTVATCIMLSSGLVLSGLSMQYIPPQRYGQGGGLYGQGIATASDLLPLPEEAGSAGGGGKAGGDAAALFRLQNKHFGRIRSALLDIESEEDEEAFQAEADKLNLAYFYAEGADDSDVLNSYAGEVYRNLMNKDSQYIANLFEFSGVLPVDMARRLGLPSSTVLGKYNPDEKGQSKDNPATWLVPNFRRVNINFYNADGILVDEYSNVKEIMAMASVYCYRHDFLDSETFEKICNALYEESHAYQISIGDVYYDSGCIHRSAKEEGEEEEKEEAEEEAKKEKEKEQEKEKEKEKAGTESDGTARTDSSGTAIQGDQAAGEGKTGQDLAEGSGESRTDEDGAADAGRNDAGTDSSGTDASGQRRIAGEGGASSDGIQASANGGASVSPDTAQEGENRSSRIMTDEEGNPLNTTIMNGETYVMVYGHADRDGKRAMHLIPLDEYEREHGKTGLGNGGPGTAMPEEASQEDAQGTAAGTGGAEAGETEIGETGYAAASDAAQENAGGYVAMQENAAAGGEGSFVNHGVSETAGNEVSVTSESAGTSADAGNMENAIEADADAMGASAAETAAANGEAEMQEAGERRTSPAAAASSAAGLGNASLTFYAEAAVSEAEEGAGQEDAILAETPPLMISAAVSESGSDAAGNTDAGSGTEGNAQTENRAAGNVQAESSTAGHTQAESSAADAESSPEAPQEESAVEESREAETTETETSGSEGKQEQEAETSGSAGEKEQETEATETSGSEAETTETAEEAEIEEAETAEEETAGDKEKEPAEEEPDDPNDKNYCPGHVDLFVRVRMSGFDDARGLRSIDLSRIAGLSAEEDSAWEGWTEENIAAVHQMVSQDWFKTYGLSISSLNPKTPLTSEEISMYLSKLPASVSTERRKVVEYALSSVGKIPYYWGGKASRPGYEGNGFGTVTEADHRGRILRGLDCSGWIQWVYWSAIGNSLNRVYSTSSLVGIGEKIHRADLQPGDIIIRTGDESHVVMFLEWTGNGNMIAIHENASSNNVSVNEVTANFPYYRRLIQ